MTYDERLKKARERVKKSADFYFNTPVTEDVRKAHEEFTHAGSPDYLHKSDEELFGEEEAPMEPTQKSNPVK